MDKIENRTKWNNWTKLNIGQVSKLKIGQISKLKIGAKLNKLTNVERRTK